MRNEACPLCGYEAGNIAGPYPGGDQLSNMLGLSLLRACSNCGLYFASPMPEQAQLDAFYASGAYWEELAPPNSRQGMHAYGQSLARSEWVKALLEQAPQAVADIGAGQGWMSVALDRVFSKTLSRYDFLEPDQEAAANILARETAFGCARLTEIPAEPKYDLILLNQVLEHTVAPVKFLSTLCKALNDGGYLYVETPHRDDQRKGDVFPHTLFFDAEVMRAAIQAGGLEVVKLESFGHVPSNDNRGKVLRVAFWLASAVGMTGWAAAIDRCLWGYAKDSKGIWLRALARKRVLA